MCLGGPHVATSRRRMNHPAVTFTLTAALIVLLQLLLLAASGGEAFLLPHHHCRVNSRRLHVVPTSGSPATRHATSSRILEGNGMPSTPGWKSGRLSRLTKWADSKEPNRPIICEFDPSGFWLWRKWKGTVLAHSWSSVLLTMSVGLLLEFFARRRLSPESWALFSVPTTTDPLIKRLFGLKKIFEYHLTLCTFILTFFTSQAFTYWQKVYNTTRAIQGRINDFCMLLVMGAQRDTEADESGRARGYSDKSRDLVKTCTRLIRMSHIFFWAVTPTASNGLNDCERFIVDAANCPLPIDDDHIGPLLLSPYGLKALVNTGQLTKEEAEDLTKTGLPPTQYAYVLLVWVGLLCMNGLEEGTLRGGPGFEGNLLQQLTSLRASMVSANMSSRKIYNRRSLTWHREYLCFSLISMT